MRVYRLLASFALFTSTAVFAHGGGTEGFSGREGPVCSVCHTSTGTAPVVAIVGPAVVTPGSRTVFKLEITGGPAGSSTSGRVGTDIAVDDASGASLLPGTGTRQDSTPQEITHAGSSIKYIGTAAPKSFSFDFTLIAPAKTGAIQLYAAGLSANGNGNDTGDHVATAKLTVTVSAGPPSDAGIPSDAGVPIDAGTGWGKDAGSPQDGGGLNVSPDAGHFTNGETTAEGVVGCDASSAGVPLMLLWGFAAGAILLRFRQHIRA